MRLYFKRQAAAVAACTLAATLLAPAAFAQGHDHMHMDMGTSSGMVMKHKQSQAVAPVVAPIEVPPLKILMPGNGDIVGSRLAIVFETPADIGKMTMGHHMMGTHLHVEADDTALMPSQEQLVRLGANKYLFLFDLPAQVGTKVLRVSWAGADHKTIQSSVQKVTVTVAADGASQ
jgi:hypothetical protein